jgi:PHD/YefM family antitoxin component YafN of YafNO toxin-antitoxin module
MTVSAREATSLDHVLLRMKESPGEAVVVTDAEGAPTCVVLSPEQYQSLLETHDVLSDPDLAEQIAGSMEDIRAGRTVSASEAWERLGW